MNTFTFPKTLTLTMFLLMFLFGLFLPVRTVAAADQLQIQPDTLNSVLTNGTLRVGVSPFTPWTFKNAEGKLVGFEVDVATQLAKDLGVQVELKEYLWENIITALLNKEIDIIVAGMTITPQRALKVNFSIPYANSGIGLATNISLTKRFKGLEDLNHPDVKIGVVAGTVAEDLAKRVFPRATIQSFQKSEQAIQAVIEGKIHGYVEDYPLPTFLALDHPDKVDEPLSEPLLTTKSAFAVNKGAHDFLQFLNAWIVAREADDWLPAAHHYWFRSLDWRKEGEKIK